LSNIKLISKIPYLVSRLMELVPEDLAKPKKFAMTSKQNKDQAILAFIFVFESEDEAEYATLVLEDIAKFFKAFAEKVLTEA